MKGEKGDSGFPSSTNCAHSNDVC